MQCDWQQLASLPAVTSSRVGNLPVEEIDAAFSASVAAVQEMTVLGPALAVPLLQYGLCVYHLDTYLLAQLRPDVILTCLQTAHSSILEGDLRDAALHAVLGYVPRVVHCAAEDLNGVWKDMQAVADALGVSEKGKTLVQQQQEAMNGAAASGRGRSHPRVVCVQWPHPLMAAGSWVPEMIAFAGAEDVCGKVHEAAMISETQLAEAKPDILVFALCGLPLEKAIQASQAAMRRFKDVFSQLPAMKNHKIAVVDGEHVFSRPGPLLTASIECLVEILHPEAQRYGHEGKLWKWMPLPTP